MEKITEEQYLEALNILKLYSEQVREEYLSFEVMDRFFKRRNENKFSTLNLSERTKNAVSKYFNKSEEDILLEDLWNFDLLKFSELPNVGIKSAEELAKELFYYNIPVAGVKEFSVDVWISKLKFLKRDSN